MHLHKISTSAYFKTNVTFSETFEWLGFCSQDNPPTAAKYFINYTKYTGFPCILYNEEWLTLCLQGDECLQITWDELRDFMGYSKTFCAKMLSNNDVDYAKTVFTAIINDHYIKQPAPSQSNLLNEAWYNNTYTSPANIAETIPTIVESEAPTPKPSAEKSLQQLLAEPESYTKPKYAWVLGKNGLTTSDEPPIPF